MGSLRSPRRRVSAIAGATFVAFVAFVVGAIGAAPSPRALAESRPLSPHLAVARPAPRAPAPTTPPTTTATTTTLAPPVVVSCPGAVAQVLWPPGWRVECEGRRAGLRGLTLPAGITYLYVRSNAVRPLQLTALHEAGHTWGIARLDSAEIGAWCAARGCVAARFYVGGRNREGWSEPGGAEDWAAVWSACHGGAYDRSYLGFAAPDAPLCALEDALIR